MDIQLVEIKFNHNTESAFTDAYNIRRSEKDPIVWPEWQRGLSKRPEDSVAAYSLFHTCGKVLTIEARFSIGNTEGREVSIRAIDASPEGAEPSVLGEVAESSVRFENGESTFKSFNLSNTAIWAAGIGVYDVVWCWQYRVDDSSSWVSFAHSSHRIYTTLSLPKKPWRQRPFNPSNTQLVWTDVLELACRWAKGIMKDADKVAEAVVREVFALGPQFIQFDTRNYGSSSYSDPSYFDCTAFLARLSGQQGNGPFVNCTDCASIVSTFANALGAKLFQARMGPPPGGMGFGLKPHLRIGQSKRIINSSFRYHEVAWKGNCAEGDDVFDACLMVNGSNTPVSFAGKWAANLSFGRLGEKHYRFRLVTKEGERFCLPIKGSAVRRQLGRVPQVLRDHPVPETAELDSSHFVRSLSLSGLQPSAFVVNEVLKTGQDREVPVIRSFWKEHDNDLSLVRVDSYECHSSHAAANGVWNLLDDFELPGMVRVEDAEAGVLEFRNAEDSTALFAAGNLVFLIRNVGPVVSMVAPLVASIKEYIFPPISSEFAHAESGLPPFQIQPEGIVGSRLELLPTSAAAGAQYWFLSDLGKVLRQGNRLIYEPNHAGEHTIYIWHTEIDGRVSTASLQLRVNEGPNNV